MTYEWESLDIAGVILVYLLNDFFVCWIIGLNDCVADFRKRDIERMLAAQVHLGTKKSEAKMTPYIYKKCENGKRIRDNAEFFLEYRAVPQAFT